MVPITHGTVMSPRTGGERSNKLSAPIPLALAWTTQTQRENQDHMGWGVCDPSEISKCDRWYTTFNTGHRQGGDPEEGTHGVGGTHTPGEGVSGLCPANPRVGACPTPGWGRRTREGAAAPATSGHQVRESRTLTASV